MAASLEISAEQVEDLARSARWAVERRLQQVPEPERCDLWALVERLCGAASRAGR